MASNTLTNLNTLKEKNTHIMNMIDNYIYLYHLDTFIVLPSYADSVHDNISVSYASNIPMLRSAPIYSYQNSGPRSLQVSFKLHRDMMTQINYGVSNAPIGSSNGSITSPESKPNDDYVDFIIKALQAAALPVYASSEKMVNPPLIALRLGNEIFIKGVVQGNIGLTYNYPLLDNGKYSNVDINFVVNEVEPYDAETVMQTGSFRGLSTSLERRIYNATNSNVSSL